MNQDILKNTGLGESIPLDYFYGPEGVSVASIAQGAGRSVYIYSAAPQEYWYSAYAVTLITPTQPYCVLRYRVEDQASKIVIVDDEEDKEVASFATSGPLKTFYFPFKVTPGRRYRVAFFKLDRIAFPLVYRGVALTCFDESSYAEAIRLDGRLEILETGAFADAALQSAKHAYRPELLLLKEHFAYVAELLKAKSVDALTNYEDTRNYYAWGLMLEPLFEQGKKLMQAAYTSLDAAFYWPFYAANLAHFAIAFTAKGGTDPVKILANGEGTCYQQALVAQMVYTLIHTDEPKPKNRILSSDMYVLGHAFFTGSEFIADITDNIFLPISPEQWNTLSPFERLDFLREKAILGINLDVSRDPSREKTFLQYTEEWLGNWYAAVVKALPYVRLLYSQVSSNT